MINSGKNTVGKKQSRNFKFSGILSPGVAMIALVMQK